MVNVLTYAPLAILGDRWWPQTAEHEGDKVSKRNPCKVWEKNPVMIAQTSDVSLLGVGTVLRLEKDARSMVK